MSIKSLFGKSIVFSGGGYFRFWPYAFIKFWSSRSSYLMTYFHPRDFDYEQPVIKNLPLKRKFKSYFGLRGSFSKFNKYLLDFDFVDLRHADENWDWDKSRIVDLS